MSCTFVYRGLGGDRQIKACFQVWQLVKAPPGHTPDPQATVLLFSV